MKDTLWTGIGVWAIKSWGFDRNNDVEGFYSLDQPGMGRLRIVLTEKQRNVLERMKRVRRVTGENKQRSKKIPGPSSMVWQAMSNCHMEKGSPESVHSSLSRYHAGTTGS